MRGEEILQAWKPRGVSLIEDYYRLVRTEAVLADLVTTKAVLASIPPARLIASSHGYDEHARLWDALQLWQKRFGTREQVCGAGETNGDAAWTDAVPMPDQAGAGSDVGRHQVGDVRTHVGGPGNDHRWASIAAIGFLVCLVVRTVSGRSRQRCGWG